MKAHGNGLSPNTRIRNGLELPCRGCNTAFRSVCSRLPGQCRTATRNTPSARTNAKVVDQFIHDQISQGHMAGPFLLHACSNLITSITVIPKKTLGKWHIIVDFLQCSFSTTCSKSTTQAIASPCIYVQLQEYTKAKLNQVKIKSHSVPRGPFQGLGLCPRCDPTSNKGHSTSNRVIGHDSEVKGHRSRVVG